MKLTKKETIDKAIRQTNDALIAVNNLKKDASLDTKEACDCMEIHLQEIWDTLTKGA